jgi:hypothetical protein
MNNGGGDHGGGDGGGHGGGGHGGGADGTMIYRRSLMLEFFRGHIIRSRTPNDGDGNEKGGADDDGQLDQAGANVWLSELSGDKCFQVNSSHLSLAKTEIESFDVVGLQEEFDASVVAVAHALEWPASELVYDNSYYGNRQLHNTDQADVKVQLLTEVEPHAAGQHKKVYFGRPQPSDLPAEIRRTIESNPRYKLEVEFYKYAKQLFRAKTMQIDRFESRVATFSKQCTEYSAATATTKVVGNGKKGSSEKMRGLLQGRSQSSEQHADTNRRKDEQDGQDGQDGQGAATNPKGNRAKKHEREAQKLQRQQTKQQNHRTKRSLQMVLASSV